VDMNSFLRASHMHALFSFCRFENFNQTIVKRIENRRLLSLIVMHSSWIHVARKCPTENKCISPVTSLRNEMRVTIGTNKKTLTPVGLNLNITTFSETLYSPRTTRKNVTVRR